MIDFYRKYAERIETFFKTEKKKILLVNGARQIGKSYLIRHVGKKVFHNYIEINLKEDIEGKRLFGNVQTTTDFYMQVGALYGKRLGSKEDTLIFLDEIQSYPHLLTMLKFLNQEERYTYVASGSQLGVALSQTPSVPIGSISVEQMYPMDFEEFVYAMGCDKKVVEEAKKAYQSKTSLSEPLHAYFMQQFRLYLLVGGLPEAINKYLESNNMAQVRKVHHTIRELYRIDASQYDDTSKLVIRRIYDMIPSYMENKKKRVIFKDIEKTKGHKQYTDYADEFEYLTNSGISLAVQAISNPRFPLKESEQKNLIKLYLNDVGLLSDELYGLNIRAILGDERSINLGTIYESVVAQELCAHGHQLHYYDNKKHGEVDYLVDDYSTLTVLPIEVKSGKDYKTHSALNHFVNNPDLPIKQAYVLNTQREVTIMPNGVVYMPIYYCMFIQPSYYTEEDMIIRPLLPPTL